MTNRTTRVIILTGSETRHRYFAQFIANDPGIDVIRTYHEGLEGSVVMAEHLSDFEKEHLEARKRSEADFFASYLKSFDDSSHSKCIERKSINDKVHIEEILEAGADMLIAFGCSIIKGPLLDEYKNRFVNLHLGLSPYYRGSGTNFWALVNDEPECLGATFMHIDVGIDTGKIIHQIRGRYCLGDNPHTVGNRLIKDAALCMRHLIVRFPLVSQFQFKAAPQVVEEKVYKMSDFSEKATKTLYDNFKNNLVKRYLDNKKQRDESTPIMFNPHLSEVTYL